MAIRLLGEFACRGFDGAGWAVLADSPLEPPPVSPACGLPTDSTKLVQGHDDHDVFQALPEGMPVIDIRRLYAMPDPRAQQSPRAAGIGEIPRRH
jgi:hypothetical protein